MRPMFSLLVFCGLACLAVLIPAEQAQAGNCCGGNCGGAAVAVNGFGLVHPQFQAAGLVGVAAVPVQAFAVPIGNTQPQVNVQVNGRRRFSLRPQRTNVQVNRFGGVRVNVR